MKNEKDLRVIRTRKAIRESFLFLLETKPIEDITIKDITEKAMINRSTFYLHYNDKYEVLKTLTNEMVKEFDHLCSGISKDTITQTIDENTFYPQLVICLSYIRKNSSLFKFIYKSNECQAFFENIAEIIIKKQNSHTSIAIKDIDLEYSQAILVSILSGVIQKWISNEMKDSDEDIAMMLAKIGYRISG